MRPVHALVATVLLVSLVACGGDGDPGARKAGAPDRPLHLVMADSQPPDAPTGLAMAAFAAEVENLSDGAMEVETRSAGEYADNAGDAKVVRALTAGDVQLATVPARAWSDAGVRSTDVLQAPFEVTSNDHMVAVTGDAELTRASLAGLENVGAHGLGLVPERLRVLLGFDTPVLVPADLKGRTMRSISPSVGRILEQFGAKPVNPTDDEYAAMRAEGSIGGAETDWTRAMSLAPGATITSDLVLYAKVVSIAANLDWWEGLTDDQRAVLEQAAAATRDAAVATLSEASADAAGFCDAGGRVAVAGSAGLAAFVRAARPWTERLDQDALARLRALRPAGAEPAPSPCAPITDGLDPGHVVAEAGNLPDGVYRFEITPAIAARWNASAGPNTIPFDGPMDPETMKRVQVTWTLAEGHYTFEIAINDEPPFTARGVYQVAGEQVLLALHPEIGNVVNRLTWRVEDDGSLVLTQVDDLKRDWYYGLPWVRIGDA
jgi:C4-dicarboxylate-binding protein DctP